MTEQVEQKTRTNVGLKYPPRYDVIIFNDDFTPVEFVIKLLVEIFNKNLKSAKDLTLEVHESGSAVAGTYSHEIAEQKCGEAITVSRGQGHPLQLKVNKVE
tara:strand:- start:63659 stop:63961 length:303 start_codon:yes stop_codon:yes gene_type:complete